jgi:hypothetical protein
MTTGSADFGSTARSRLPKDVGQIRTGACLIRRASGADRAMRARDTLAAGTNLLNVGAVTGRPHCDRPSRLAVPPQPG